VPATSILLVLLLLYQFFSCIGSNRTLHISNFSTNHLAHGSSGIQIFPTSSFFFGLSLLQGICYWGDMASIILPSCAGPSTPSFTQCDVIIPASKGRTPFVSLGMFVTSEKESQSIWGSSLVILPLCTSFLTFWEVSMVQPIFIFARSGSSECPRWRIWST
jgi:hypothetical protein